MRLWALLLSGCVVTGDAGALTGTGGMGSSGSVGTSVDASSEGSTGEAKLDVEQRDAETEECASVSQTTTIEEAPSDILIVVDRLMDAAAMDSTFVNFAQLIANDGIEDVRVVMLAGYPPDGVCIDEPPLGLGECPTNDDNPPLYHRVEEVIAADTLLDQIIDTHARWSPAFRADARKHLFVLSSGDPDLSADAFDAALTALDPSYDPYLFHAMAPASDGGDCSAVNEGASWSAADELAALAAATGGVFEDACDYNVKVLFETLLSRIQEVALSCEYDIPPPPAGHVFDKGKVNVDYDDGFGIQTIGYVEAPGDCPGVDNGWYYDDNIAPQRVLMCPQTCARFQALNEASIELRFGCTTIPAG